MTGCSHNNIFIRFRWFLNYTVLLPNNIMIEHHQSLLHAVEVSQIHTRPLLTATLSLLLALYKLDLDRSGGTILNKQILNVSLVHVLRDAVEVDDLGVRQDPINQSEISIYCVNSQSETSIYLFFLAISLVLNLFSLQSVS